MSLVLLSLLLLLLFSSSSLFCCRGRCCRASWWNIQFLCCGWSPSVWFHVTVGIIQAYVQPVDVFRVCCFKQTPDKAMKGGCGLPHHPWISLFFRVILPAVQIYRLLVAWRARQPEGTHRRFRPKQAPVFALAFPLERSRTEMACQTVTNTNMFLVVGTGEEERPMHETLPVEQVILHPHKYLTHLEHHFSLTASAEP